MGWRFRKTVIQGPFRWNLSKKGIGWSLGVPGLRYGISSTGQQYVSVGIPGTGFYYIKYFPIRAKQLKNLPGKQITQCTQNTLTSLPHKQPLTQSKIKENQQPWWRQKNL